MTSINYRYFVHAKWAETSSETPAAIGATFLKTLDALSGVDPLFAGWQVFRNLQIAEDEQPRQVPLDAVGSSRVDLQACKLEYSIVSPK